MTRIMKWALAAMIFLGALFAPFSSPVSASEARHQLNGAVLPDNLVRDEIPSLESDRGDVTLSDLSVGASTWIEARTDTRVNLPYNCWVKTTQYVEPSGRPGPMAISPIYGFRWGGGSRVKVTRTGEAECTMDIRGSSALWSSADIMPSGIERPYWDGPESNDRVTYWRVTRVIHDEMPHPVFWIPTHQIPLSRRGTPLWRQKLGTECYTPWDELHALPEKRAWVDCTAVTRNSFFRDGSGLPAVKLTVAGEKTVAGVHESGFCVKVNVLKGTYYPPRPKEDAGVEIVNSISRVNNVSQGARFLRLQVWQFGLTEPEGPSATLRPVSDKR